MTVVKNLKMIEQEMFGKSLTNRERIEKQKVIAKELSEKIASLTDSFIEKLPTGAVKIIIHPAHVTEIATTIGESLLDFEMVLNTHLNQLGLTVNSIPPGYIEGLHKQYEVLKQVYIAASDQIFEEWKIQLAKQVVQHFHELIRVYASSLISDGLQKTFGATVLDFTAKDWKDNIVYGFEQRIKVLLQVKTPGGSTSLVTDDQYKKLGDRYLELYSIYKKAKAHYNNIPAGRDWHGSIKAVFPELLDSFTRNLRDHKPSDLALEQAATELNITYTDVKTLYNYIRKVGIGVKTSRKQKDQK